MDTSSAHVEGTLHVTHDEHMAVVPSTHAVLPNTAETASRSLTVEDAVDDTQAKPVHEPAVALHVLAALLVVTNIFTFIGGRMSASGIASSSHPTVRETAPYKAVGSEPRERTTSTSVIDMDCDG